MLHRMTLFSSRLTRQPLPFDRAAAADTAASFSDLAPDLRELLAHTASCSPFLKDLMRREGDWLRAALSIAPEEALDQVMADLAPLTPDLLPGGLRRAKRRVALLTALADLGGVWRLEEVTAALTHLADTAVDLSIKALVADEIRRGKLPGATPDDASTGAGMVALAMGKMGAGELNYSSDIDLVCLFDETRYGSDAPEARTALSASRAKWPRC